MSLTLLQLTPIDSLWRIYFSRYWVSSLAGFLQHTIWVRDKFTRTGAPGITFVVRPHVRPADAKFQCKILVDITNRRSARVRIAAAYFVFSQRAPLTPD